MRHKNKKRIQRLQRWLIALVLIFIVVGIAIGGMNSAFGKSDNLELKEQVHLVYLLYETVFRTIIVIIASILSMGLMKLKHEHTTMRGQNMLSFSIFMTLALVVIPLLTGLFEINIALMPLPWSSMPLQVIHNGYFFSTHLEKATVSILLAIFIGYQVVVFLGTLLIGRRFHCSMICPFSGTHAETFSMVLPLIGSKRKYKSNKRVKMVLDFFKIVMFIFSVALLSLMAMDLVGFTPIFEFELLKQFEMIKYMIGELLLLQILYVAYNGRGYCYYCPAGTAIGLVARIAKQRIETDASPCVDCGLCDQVCEMGLSISQNAKVGQPVASINCLGCGHCIDRCPKRALSYSTGFLAWWRAMRKC